MRKKLEEALANTLWVSHRVGNKYKMDGEGKWTLTYYPTFECGKSREVYTEPRALMERPAIFEGKEGTDFREVPLRYLERIKNN